jgi:hypothetical protein
MKKSKRTIPVLCVIAAFTSFALSSHAGVSVTTSPVGAATTFQSSALSGNGTLSFTTLGAQTIGGGVSQGMPDEFGAGTNFLGVGWGEVFKWAGSANGDYLTAYDMVVNAANASRTYQPFLLDLGTGTYNTSGSTFNPSTAPNLLSSSTITVSGLSAGPRSFVEFALTGADTVALTVGHSYAFGLLNLDPAAAGTDMFFQRANGAQTDPNGVQFVTGAGGLSSTSAGVPGWGGGPRPIFMGLYTSQVPEPSSMALLGGGLAALLMVRRSRVN